MKKMYASGIVAGKRVDCEAVEVPDDWPEGWPYVAAAPDPKLQYPVYDWDNHKWIDQSGASQGQQIATLSKQVESLKTTAHDLQTASDEHSKATQASDQKLDKLTQMLTLTNVTLGKITQALNAKPASSTDNKGGNN